MNGISAGISSTDEVYAVVTEREVKAAVLYRFAAQSAQGEAKALLERLYQRGETFLAKLEEGRKSGGFKNEKCSLPDYGYFKTLLPTSDKPGRRVPEILMFAIRTKHDDYRICKEAAEKCATSPVKELWLLLAEEHRRQRLELETYYQKEVIDRI